MLVKVISLWFSEEDLSPFLYDAGSRYVFVGDASGRITLLNLNQNGDQAECRVVRELRGHEQSVTCLSWDSVKSHLFSSSSDKSVILWDIGGAKGAAMELQGHTKEVSSVLWWPGGNACVAAAAARDQSQYEGLAVSGGHDGLLIFWYMDPSRAETPNWSESDVCQICAAPFFWNVKKMWSIMSVGVRQHHCRRCGKAVCDKCSPFRSTLPALGFERDVRVCNTCWPLHPSLLSKWAAEGQQSMIALLFRKSSNTALVNWGPLSVHGVLVTPYIANSNALC
ncbi:unnamed protein product [Echinostoma caproni]|uniref:FYVE-type domain-containing protein n=1 Tax=Echinostoma caproni TaxID=27848 RepID=A0A183AN16_9TREM|nr:unnamed protein product [Echinostoma caproni]